jgi:hypothetical protein
MHKLARLAALTLLITLAIPVAARRMSPGDEVARKVRLYVEARDCSSAVARLNEGVAKKYPEVNMLAGAMFEHGVCVKADWDRAVGFYSNAFDGGQKAAMYSLMSGFAAPQHGPDMAAALWWGNRPTNDFSSSACRVSAANREDPDRFVAELRSWPQQRLAQCNYVIGVMATIIGEIRFPTSAERLGLGGLFRLRFEPTVPRIDIKTEETREVAIGGWLDGNAMDDRNARSVKGSFEASMRQVADRALKRYPQPAGIAPDSAIETKFDFGFDFQ